MRISALKISRYRAFREPHDLPLSPLTIIIGRNGSGKSVLTRLPLLISNAVSKDASGPLDLFAGGIDHADSFQDLVNMRGALPFTIGAEIEAGPESREFVATLRYVSENRSLAIERFELLCRSTPLFIAEISSEDELTSPKPTYKLMGAGRTIKNVKLAFEGLFPIVETDPFVQLVHDAHEMFRSAFPMPSYLGPFRVEPARSMRQPRQSIKELGPRGELTLELLADDRLRHGGHLSATVSDWFAKSLGQGIAIDVTGEQPQVMVKDMQSGLEVSLSDTGAGFSQSIPVVVQNIAYQTGRLTSSMLIVEQPELHLHPAAHGDLADLMIESATGKQPATCIVETHSEQFIMRVRRRVAEGLDPKTVTIWSLNHREAEGEKPIPVEMISLDESGNPNRWPTGVFEESFADLTEMRRAARKRSK